MRKQADLNILLKIVKILQGQGFFFNMWTLKHVSYLLRVAKEWLYLSDYDSQHLSTNPQHYF